MSNPNGGPVAEPQWRPAAFWWWLPIVLLVTGYLVFLLVVWCVDGIRNIGIGDPYFPWVALLAASPFITFTLIYLGLLRGWNHRGDARSWPLVSRRPSHVWRSSSVRGGSNGLVVPTARIRSSSRVGRSYQEVRA